MAGKHKQLLCRVCKKRPPWKYKNCPPGVCKRCYHAHVWPDRPEMRKLRRAASAASGESEVDELLDAEFVIGDPAL
jgi:hypothetical protein